MVRLLRMADPFDSAWLKWGRAVLHAHDLFDEINALQLTEENFCKTRTQYEPKRHCLSLRVDWIADPPPVLSVKLGDVVHNYRSCLDHIAWTIVGRGKTPPPLIGDFEQAGVYFPICSTRDEFNASLEPVIKGLIVRRVKLPGVRLADSAIVRRYQPYRRGKRYLSLHVLTILEELSNRDKHREIWPILVIPQGGMVLTWPPEDCVVTRDALGTRAYPLELDAEIHRIFVRKTGPNPYMKMQPHLTVHPAVTPRVSVREWLTQTRSFVYQLLRDFAEPPRGTLQDLGVLKIVEIP
jgi:hypothetical protein